MKLFSSLSKRAGEDYISQIDKNIKVFKKNYKILLENLKDAESVMRNCEKEAKYAVNMDEEDLDDLLFRSYKYADMTTAAAREFEM